MKSFLLLFLWFFILSKDRDFVHKKVAELYPAAYKS